MGILKHRDLHEGRIYHSSVVVDCIVDCTFLAKCTGLNNKLVQCIVSKTFDLTFLYLKCLLLSRIYKL